MFDKFKDFFEGSDQQELSEAEQLALVSERELQVACCVMLLEAAFADLNFPDTERETIRMALINQFTLSASQVEQLIYLAGIVKHKKERLSVFTNIINQRCNDEQRQSLYANIWRVIKADKNVDQRELDIATEFGARLKLSLEQQIEARKMIWDHTVLSD